MKFFALKRLHEQLNILNILKIRHLVARYHQYLATYKRKFFHRNNIDVVVKEV